MQSGSARNLRIHHTPQRVGFLVFLSGDNILFNPVVRSLRAIEQASELRKVQRKLGCQRASLGSLSEATDVFQPERLKEIVAELGKELEPIARDPRLKDVQQTIPFIFSPWFCPVGILNTLAWAARATCAAMATATKKNETAPSIHRYPPFLSTPRVSGNQ